MSSTYIVGIGLNVNMKINNGIDQSWTSLRNYQKRIFDRNLKIKLLSTHFEEFVSEPTHNVHNWDIGKDSFKPALDPRNNFNRVKAQYNFLPNRNELFKETVFKKNQAAIDDSNSPAVSKRILFPHKP